MIKKLTITITIAIAILLSGCNGSSDKLPILDLDSAIKNHEITNIEILRKGEVILFVINSNSPQPDKNDDVVIFRRSGARSEAQYNQEIQIYSVDNNYSEILLNSKIVRYFRNKKLKYEAECINGWIEGDVKTYDSLGNIASKFIYKKGKLNGVCKHYFPNGKLARSITFIEGEQSGIEKAYHENGNIEYEGQYFNGIKGGEHIWYFSNGNKSAIHHYSFGIRPHGFYANKTEMGFRAHGEFVDFFENGSIEYKAKYVNGLPDGQVSAYRSEGKLFYSEFWHNSHIEGKTEYYYENGQLQSTGTYNEQGIEDGEFREYHDNGKLRLYLKFDKGNIIEQHYYNNKINNSEYEDRYPEDLRSIIQGEPRY